MLDSFSNTGFPVFLSVQMKKACEHVLVCESKDMATAVVRIFGEGGKGCCCGAKMSNLS